MKDTISIYGLHHPDNNHIRYVGKAIDPEKRLRFHISNGRHNRRNVRLSGWIREILDEGKNPKYTVLETCSNFNWQEKERFWISKLQKNNLCNIHEGGAGGAHPAPLWMRERKINYIKRWSKIEAKIPIDYEKDVLKKYPDKKITTIQNARYCRTYDFQILEVLEQLVKNK